MRHNIFDPVENLHPHKIPISPQNYDPIYQNVGLNDKAQNYSSQKKIIFSSGGKSRQTGETLPDYDIGRSRYDERDDKSDIKATMSLELRGQLENLRAELTQQFNSVLKDFKNSGKISQEEIQEIKKQISANKKQFEEIQSHMGEVSQKFTEINSLCVKELEGIKHTIGLSYDPNYSQNQASVASELSLKQMELQFKTFKQNMINEINIAIKNKGKTRLNENVVNQLKEIKRAFEDELKENFEVLNGRVKRVEENLNDIMRKKRAFMEKLRDDFSETIKGQENNFSEEMKQVQQVLSTKCEEQQAKMMIRNEVNTRIEPLLKEADKIKKSVSQQKDEIDQLESYVNRSLETLQHETQNQFYEIQNIAQRKPSPHRGNEILDRRIEKLQNEADHFNKALVNLKSQLEEVQKIYQVIQMQAKQKNEEVLTKVENKIVNLQGQISALESHLKKQNPINIISEPRDYQYTIATSTYPSATKSYKPLASSEILPSSYLGLHDRKPSANKLPEHTYPSPSDTPQPKEEPKTQVLNTHLSSYFPNPQNTSATSSSSDVKYYGDPKVRSIIEEFYQKKRETDYKPSYTIPIEQNTLNPVSLERASNSSTQASFFNQGIPSITVSQPLSQPLSQPVSQPITNTYSSPFEGLTTKYNDNYLNFARKIPDTLTSLSPVTDSKLSSAQKYDITSQKPSFIETKSPNEPKYDENREVVEKKEDEVGKLQFNDIILPSKQNVNVPVSTQNPTIAPANTSFKGKEKSFATSGYDLDQFQDCVDHISGLDPNDLGADVSQRKQVFEDPRENLELQKKLEQKKLKHQKILAQIDYFINGTVSNLLNDNGDDGEIYCNLDDDGFIFDDEGAYVMDTQGNRVQLTPEQIEKFNNNNMIE